MKPSNPKAFSLMEVLIAVGIFSLIMLALYTVFAVGHNAWMRYNTTVGLHKEARWALFTLTKDLREATGILITKNSDAVTISFRKPREGVVSFTFSRNGAQANQIVRENNAKKRVVARDISDLSFDYADTRTIGIAVTAMKKTFKDEADSFYLKEMVTLRRASLNDEGWK